VVRSLNTPSRNIELKARLHDLPAARLIAERWATAHLGVQQQTDTYFGCTVGRLKLREIEGQPPQLIDYMRPDEPGAKASDYRIVEFADAETIRAVLTETLGILVVVVKRREIFLDHNVRIHLDEVQRLGSFLEFEAVLSDTVDAEAGQRQIVSLREQFVIADADLVRNSYSDMLLVTADRDS
jgi:predicted adenylyl cyclase CyaB